MLAPHPKRPAQEESVEVLPLLAAVSRWVGGRESLDHILHATLDELVSYLGVVRATVTLLERDTKDIRIEASRGLSESEVELGRYRLGEGITGRVVETGQPMSIARVGDDPEFSNRTGARDRGEEDHAFLCVPIELDGEVLGALGVDLPPTPAPRLEVQLDLLLVVATLIAQTVAARRAHRESELRRDTLRPGNIIGRARAMRPVFDAIATVADSDATVLVRGESGVGKELVADAIHYAGPRADRPLIKVNCAALPESVLESELFGHEKGAFTGALNQRKGRFELADGGTIFLDEIGDFSPSTQITLLRILQEQAFERVGGHETLRTDVRIITATNRDLEAEMAEGRFRQDLYYRLNVFPIHTPPLRDRRTDIPLLADAFVEKYARAGKKEIKRITTQAIDMLMAYHWPGNVRELENCIERAVLLSRDGVIHAHHLPPTLQTAEATDTFSKDSLQSALDAVERDLIDDALKTARGNMARAARALGLTERKMGLRVHRFGIDPKRYRVSKR